MSISDIEKKRGRGRPYQFPVQKLLRLDQETADALDKAVAADTEAKSASEAIRRILRDWLEKHGYLTQEN